MEMCIVQNVQFWSNHAWTLPKSTVHIAYSVHTEYREDRSQEQDEDGTIMIDDRVPFPGISKLQFAQRRRDMI